LDFFNKWRTNHTIATIHQIIINHIAVSSVIITEDVKILNFLASHITIIHTHRLVKDENRNHISNNPNNAKSTNAVIFAKAAKPKNNQAIITYFNISFLLSESFLFCKKIKPANKANRDKAITHKSVLLSTITRNAHIPLVNRSNNIYHHILIQFQLPISASIIFLSHFFNSVFSSSIFSFLLFIKENI
jgi:ABC-type microcin C transport system duplicated ATPase subunit YejF